jgi:hypothetical protein
MMSANGERVGDLTGDLRGDLERLFLADLGGDLESSPAFPFDLRGDMERPKSLNGDLDKPLVGDFSFNEFSKLERIGLQLSPNKSSPIELELEEMCDKLFALDRRSEPTLAYEEDL